MDTSYSRILDICHGSLYISIKETSSKVGLGYENLIGSNHIIAKHQKLNIFRDGWYLPFITMNFWWCIHSTLLKISWEKATVTVCNTLVLSS